MNYLSILKLILSMLPLIHAAIDQIDDLFPQGGYGAHKLELVKSILEKAMQVSDLGNMAFDSIWPTLNAIISQIVAIKKHVAATGA